MNNLSDGKSDGIVIMYAKDGQLYPVGLKQEQVEILDMVLGTIPGRLKVFGDKPQGKLDKLI